MIRCISQNKDGNFRFAGDDERSCSSVPSSRERETGFVLIMIIFTMNVIEQAAIDNNTYLLSFYNVL